VFGELCVSEVDTEVAAIGDCVRVGELCVSEVDTEVAAIGDCVRALEPLDAAARRRVLAYVTDRELCS